MNYKQILLDAINREESLSGLKFEVDITQTEKLSENFYYIDVQKLKESDSIDVYSNGKRSDNSLLIHTLKEMLESGELDIIATDKCTEKHINYIKKLTKTKVY